MQIDDQNLLAGEGAFVAGRGFGLANVDLLFGVKAEKKIYRVYWLAIVSLRTS